jgi:hypothetical protein
MEYFVHTFKSDKPEKPEEKPIKPHLLWPEDRRLFIYDGAHHMILEPSTYSSNQIWL